ncbi:Uncharacterised protein [Serratia ficaria]|uniref:Uncharacterized protein n=1 Tax=Serratia ficaria TaxID=61651 RepID=A0A240BWU0_SERFI|nr:hypothetical protein C7332_3615 [Serratia ficaria]CAI0704069.1 Uncharacterised protein [Serratia ficaria]CAI0836579.1 Uncharacterised protein [Serratia ficaria]CAI0878186.1 Uncharacterised protein [Serratia ficaria]CAI0902760.1 Uncharacterised protein [Serratia ficaria]
MHPLCAMQAKKKAPEIIAAPQGVEFGELVLSSVKVLVIRSFDLGDAGL